MVTIRINGNKVNILTSKYELTLHQAQRIAAEVDFENLGEDWIKLFNILANSNFRIEDVEMKIKLLDKIHWALNGIVFDEFMPDEIVINDYKVKVPMDIGELSIGQAIALKQSIRKFKYSDEAISKAVSIYIQPLVNGKKFSVANAKEVEQEILKMPAYLFNTLGNFILRERLNAGTRSISLKKLILSSRIEAQKILLLLWLTLVVFPAMGTYLYVQGMLNFFRLTLITFMRVAHSLPFVTFLITTKTNRNLRSGIVNSITN